jgi:arylsulfatase A-like enzyme
MKRRSFLMFIAFIFSGISVFSQQLPIGKPNKPNIVIILSDDHAYQAISAYGSKLMQTPNIDRIAKEGVIFKKGYVTNSLCGPSRAAILTGKYSHKNGIKDNDHSSFDGTQNTFIKELSKVGYQTAWIGKWHLETQPQGFSFWQILPGQGSYYNPDFLTMDGGKKRFDGYVANVVEDVAEAWLDKRDPSKPFCMVIGHKNTHRTWMPDLPDLRMFNNTKFPLPANFYDNYQNRSAAAVQDMTIDKTMLMGYDLKMFDNKEAERKEGNITRMSPAQREQFMAYYDSVYKDFKSKNLSGNALAEWKYQRYMQDYLATAASLDRNIGRTLDYLDNHNLTNNTIVIYVSDQGFFMGEHGWFDKRFMYEESFRTPMVMRYPGVVKAGTVNNNLVMNVDIAPTLLNAAGAKIPDDIQGKSFLPLLKNKKAKGRDAMYYHYYENGEHSVSPHFGISTGRYKLIRFYTRIKAWELYDLKKDKSEMANIYGQKGYEKITAELKKRLSELIAEYEDAEAKKILQSENLMGNRFLTICSFIRVNQIEVTRDTSIGTDESEAHTAASARLFRETIEKNLPGARITWALSWLALKDQRENYVDLKKQIVFYHKKYGDEITFIPGGFFANMYNTREQINRDLHEGLQMVSDLVGGGYRPLSVISGFLAADNLKYLAKKEGIHVCQGNIWSQYAVDNGDGEGSISYPYYPSTEHFCKPAQSKKDRIDCVNLDGWTVDFINARYPAAQFINGVRCGSRQGVGPIETILRQGTQLGTKEMLATTAAHFDTGYALNNFAWITCIWELSLLKVNKRNDGMEGLNIWLSEMRKRWPETKGVTHGELGMAWRKQFNNNNDINYRFVQNGSGVCASDTSLKIRWFMNKDFRLALLSNQKENAPEKVIDFTRYDLKAQEPADPRKGQPIRNWSLMNRLNQKGTRAQDKPININELNADEKAIIKNRYPELIEKN